jgi:hypothetical protein
MNSHSQPSAHLIIRQKIEDKKLLSTFVKEFFVLIFCQKRIVPSCFAFFALTASTLHAQTATQTINLVNGWNAIWLEVEPQDANGQALSPTIAFNTATNTAITVIASPKPQSGLAEIFGDTPGAATGTFNQDGWERWQLPDIGNNNLGMTTGNRGYLIKTTAPVTLSIMGNVSFDRPQWTPDRYNLVGFGIDQSITFDNFFTPSADAHPLGKIYTLGAGGSWSVVSSSANIADGKAYWIFSDGPSKYMGPVAVDFDRSFTGVLNFGGPADAIDVYTPGTGDTVFGQYDLEEIVLTNLSDTDATPVLTRLTDDEIVLAETSPDADSLKNRVVGSGDIGASYTVPSPGVPFGETKILTLAASASRQWVNPSQRTNVYRLNTHQGASFYIPVSAVNSSLPPLPNGASTVDDAVGLWVGEVSVDAVTSIVEDGEPTRPAAGSAPIRILLHSNGMGVVSLLSQVTIMQTKTADEEVEPVPVLVINPQQIPFFEGVKERNGKRVGLRIESVAYDMPRKTGSETEYDFSVSLTGQIGTGKSVATITPLTLDPTHRSNPFRHALHREHTQGRTIRRSMTIVFDPDQTIKGRLQGTFTETIEGLTNTNLQLTGRVEMRRVSAVPTLEGAQ